MDRDKVEMVGEKHYLLMCSSETAHYKAEQHEKVQKILQLPHTHPQTEARQHITEENTKQSTVAHRGTLDILKHTVRDRD